MFFNWISTSSSVALNKRGVKNAFQLHYCQYKIDITSFLKAFVFSSLVESAILKKR